jgi:hypothetical protein
MRFLLAAVPLVGVFVTHYLVANAYAAVCAPLSVQGFIASIFTTASPVCNSLLGILTYTSNNYNLLMSTILLAGISGFTSMFTKHELANPADGAPVPT